MKHLAKIVTPKLDVRLRVAAHIINKPVTAC